MVVWGVGRGRKDRRSNCGRTPCELLLALGSHSQLLPNPMRLACIHPTLNLLGFSHRRPLNSTGPQAASCAGIARPWLRVPGLGRAYTHGCVPVCIELVQALARGKGFSLARGQLAWVTSGRAIEESLETFWEPLEAIGSYWEALGVIGSPRGASGSHWELLETTGSHSCVKT